MTTLEFVLITIIYIAIGLWISYKRDWYVGWCDDLGWQGFVNIVSIAFMPINLIIVLIKEFFIRKWKYFNP